MTTYKLKKLDIWSVAKIGAVLGLIWGIIWGIVMALWIGSLGIIAKSLFPMAGLGAGLAFVSMVIFGLIAGFIGGAIWSFIYNIAAGFVGPIQLDLEV
ncbi:MAG TPA: hypothetical protein VMC42_08395 [Methanoregulaceae archaeon]|nr:hypothetical protein [Methanoregulaceae archaeon]